MLPSVTMKLQVSMLLVAWFAVLGCVQAEFFTSIGMCQQDYHLSAIISSSAKGCHCLKTVLIQDGMASPTGFDQF